MNPGGFHKQVHTICEAPTPSRLPKQLHTKSIAALNSLQVISWDRVRKKTSSDEEMTTLIDILESSIPEFRHELPPPLRCYHQFRDNLHTSDGVVLYKSRVVIPPSLRQEVGESGVGCNASRL